MSLKLLSGSDWEFATVAALWFLLITGLPVLRRATGSVRLSCPGPVCSCGFWEGRPLMNLKGPSVSEEFTFGFVSPQLKDVRLHASRLSRHLPALASTALFFPRIFPFQSNYNYFQRPLNQIISYTSRYLILHFTPASPTHAFKDINVSGYK